MYLGRFCAGIFDHNSSYSSSINNNSTISMEIHQPDWKRFASHDGNMHYIEKSHKYYINAHLRLVPIFCAPEANYMIKNGSVFTKHRVVFVLFDFKNSCWMRVSVGVREWVCDKCLDDILWLYIRRLYCNLGERITFHIMALNKFIPFTKFISIRSCGRIGSKIHFWHGIITPAAAWYPHKIHAFLCNQNEYCTMPHDRA